MKTLFTNYDEIKKEIESIQLQEKNATFIKKQYFAHELHRVMKNSGFIEAKLVSSEWLFDARTKSESYICRIAEDYENSSSYMGRMMQASKHSEFYSLIELTKMSMIFFQNEKTIAVEIEESMNAVGFGVDYESIVRAVMTQGEYQQWLVMVEKELLEKGVKSTESIESIEVISMESKLVMNKI